MTRLVLLFVLCIAGACNAQILVPAIARNQPTQVVATTAYDGGSHFYTYRYTLTNKAGNSAAADTFVVKLAPGVDVITNIQDPQGWTHFYSEDRGTIHWAAVGYFDNEALADPSGNISVSDYAIAAGATLGGFSFQSFSPPGTGAVITQTFAPLPTAVSEDDFDPIEVQGWLPEDGGFKLQTTTPVPDVDWNGNRRPTVDGFLVFANVKDKDSFTGSVLVVIRFAFGGESVLMDTFKAHLNGVDVTSQFTYNATYKGYSARFEPAQGVLTTGSNVPLTTVSGTIPGVIDKPVLDTDWVSFKFSP